MYLNNKLSTSRATLPLTVVFVVASLLMANIFAGDTWQMSVCTVCTLVAGYFVELINIRNILVKGYSRLTVCFFLLLSLVTIRLTPSHDGAIVQFLFILFLFTILPTYQNRYAPATFFVAFLFIGLASVLFVHILYFIPFLWIIIAVWIQSPSVKNYFASLCGLLLPYFFWATHIVYTLEPTPFINHFEGLISFKPIGEGLFETHLFVATIALVVLNIFGIAHYLRYSFHESQKNRMLYSVIFFLTILTLIFLILQPQHKEVLLRLLILTTSMSLAHYFTFAKDKFTHYFFIFLLVLILAATAVVIWNL